MITFPFTMFAGQGAAPAIPEAQFYEPFASYASDLNAAAGGLGQVGSWQSETGNWYGIAGGTGLTYANLLVNPQAGLQGANSTKNFVALSEEVKAIVNPRDVETKTSYLSFLFHVPVNTDRRFAVCLGKTGARSAIRFYGCNANSGTWRLAGIENSGGNAGSVYRATPTPLETVLIVAKLVMTWSGTRLTYDAFLSLFSGGVIPTTEPTWEISLTGREPYNQYTLEDMDSLALFSEWSSIPAFQVDEIRISDDFARVVPVVG